MIRAIAHYVTHLTDLYRRLDPDRESEFLAQLERAVLETHDILLKEGSQEYGGKGGATTLTMLFALWPRAYVVHLGDSGCFRLREGRLERMTRDQTVAEDLVRAGALRPSEARRSPFTNVLASAVARTMSQCSWAGSVPRPAKASRPRPAGGLTTACAHGNTQSCASALRRD